MTFTQTPSLFFFFLFSLPRRGGREEGETRGGELESPRGSGRISARRASAWAAVREEEGSVVVGAGGTGEVP